MASLNPSLVVLFVTTLLWTSDRGGGGAELPRPQSAANAAIAAAPLPATRNPDAKPMALKIAKAPDGLFYVSGSVNGTAIRFLVDTGANLVVLTADDARRIGLTAADANAGGSVQTASGQANMDRVTLGRVSVAGHSAENVDAAVMHDGLSVSLLGQNLLSKLGPITMSGDEITLQRPPR